jgi:hypothetical protein
MRKGATRAFGEGQKRNSRRTLKNWTACIFPEAWQQRRFLIGTKKAKINFFNWGGTNRSREIFVEKFCIKNLKRRKYQKRIE